MRNAEGSPQALVARSLGRSQPLSVLGLLLEMVHVEGVSFIDLADEELVVRQELSLVNNCLIQEHSCDDTGDLVSIDSLDRWVNVVTDKVFPVFALDLLEVG